MKKIALFLAIIGLYSFYSVDAQDITVADGTTQLPYFPLSGYHWNQSQHSQSIYPSSMLTELQGKYITTLTWYMVAAQGTWLDSRVQTIRLGITTDENLNNGMIDANTSVVWSGPFSAYFVSDIIRIPLDTPFLYNGGNLLVEVIKAGSSDTYRGESYYGQTQSDIMSLNQVGTYYAPYTADFLPKLTFTCQDGLCSYPEFLEVSDIAVESATLSWKPGILGSAGQYVVAYRSNTETEYTEVAVNDTFLTLTDLHPITTYLWKVQAVCSDTLSSDWSLESSFTTHRRLATIPYYCNFEDSTENVNWCLPINPDAEANRWYTGTYISCSESHSLYVSSNGGATNLTYGFGTNYPAWAYREFLIDTLYPQYHITFKHRGYEHYTAYWGPPATLFNAVPPVLQPDGSVRLSDNQSLPQDSVWMTHSYSFSVATPGTYRLYFDWRTAFYPNSGKPAASIDDISIEGVPCLVAHTLTTTDITDTSATISWQYNCVDSPMGYEVGYKTAGDYDYTVFTVYDTTAVTLTGLTPNTTYYWRVKTLYDDSFATDWCTAVSFQTDVIWVHPIPYTCDFEDATENLAWNVPVISGNNKNRWYIGHNTYNSSSTSLYITTAANGSNNSYINSEGSPLWTYRDLYLDPQYSGYELSFDAKVCGIPGYAFAQVFMGAPVNPTDSAAADSMVLIDDAIDPTGGYNTTAWRHFEYYLDSTFAGHKRLFFVWQNHYNANLRPPAIAIDNIAVSGTQCSRPLQLAYTVADTTVQLTWQDAAIGSPESYTVAYKTITDSVYTFVEAPGTELTLTGLQPLTEYMWQVRLNCSNDEHSVWSSGQNFTTYQLLTTMPYTCDFEDSLVNVRWATSPISSNHKWCIGSAVQHNGQYASYISNDNGETYQTTNPGTATAYLYQDFLFDTTYSEYLLTFDFKTFDTTTQTDISVYVTTPATPAFAAPSAGNRVGQVTFTDTLWHPISMAVNRTHSGIQRLILEWKKPSNDVAKGSCAVDDLTFTGVMVGRPYALTSSNIRHNSAVLAWNSGNRHTPASYQLAYRKAEEATYTIITFTDSVGQITMLTPQTVYYWKVRAVAANDEMSAWSDEATFYTAVSTPFYTGFEDESDWIGWHVSSVSQESDKWVIGNAVSCDSTYSLYVSNDNGVTNASATTYANDVIGIYRDIYIAPGETEYQITFDYLGMGSSVQLQSLENPASHPVLTATVPTSDYWQHQRIAVDSSYTGFNRLFFKRSRGAFPNNAGAVDNLAVEASVCPPPTSLASILVLPNAAQISWNGVGSPSYQVAYKMQSDSSYSEIELQDTSVVISNLHPDVPYFWKVRAQCNGVYGEWSSEHSFNTMPLLPYSCDFEDADEIAHWTYDVSSEWNYWEIGAAPMDNGNSTLHVASAWLGHGNYNYYASAYLWAYRDICLAGNTSKYQISFDYRGLGQSGADFARFYIGPPTTPSGVNAPADAEQISGDLCMVPTWTHFSFEVDSTHTGLQRIYFQWRCNDLYGLNPGAAFDNITAQVSDCAIPTHPETVVTTATTATLGWTPGDANALPASYTVAYRLLNDTVFTEVNSDDTTVQITGLQPDTYYYWRVRANCSDIEHSLWSNSVCFATTQTTYADLPYECGFEEAAENSAWSHLHLGGDNEWVVGTAAVLDGDSALYVSSDNGETNTYTNTTVSTDWLYRDLYFPSGNDEYEISFDFRGSGSAYHYARVYLGRPEVMFESFTPADAELLSGSLYNIPDWQHFSFHLDSTHSGLQRLYLLWQNNTYSATQPPAAIDNIAITAQPCREPINLISEADNYGATLSWTMRFGGAGADYTVAYRSFDDSTETYVNVSDTFLILQNLDSNTHYSWKVRQNCDTSCSIWSESNIFYTNNQILYICDFDTPETISSWIIPQNRDMTHWYAGRHSESPYNGTLYVSSDGGLSNVYDISVASNVWAYTDVYIPPGSTSTYLSFDFKGIGENNPDYSTTYYDYLMTYVGPPAIPSGSAVPTDATSLERIAMNEQWTHYNYVLDATHTGTQRIYFLWHNDNSYGTNPPASIDNVCLSREMLPLTGTVTATPYDTLAHLTWHIDGTEQPVSYTVSYCKMATDSTLMEIIVPDTVFDLGDLLTNTDYFCRVRANYAGGNFSSWSMTQFRTLSRFAIAPYFCGFEDETENGNWQFVSNESVNQWVIDTAVANEGDKSLYISNDGGITNEYTITSATNAWAYRHIYLDPADAPYMLSFDYRGEGEMTTSNLFDYAKVFIGPPIVPSAGAPASELTQLGETLYNQSDWNTHYIVIDPTHTGYVGLFLYWKNDTYWGNNPAAAFDNISIVPYECVPPADIAVDNVSTTEVSFHFTDVIPYHHDWDVAIAPENVTLDETNAVTLHDELSHTFTGLVSGTSYTLYVRTRCDETDFSEWISYTVTTLTDTLDVTNYQLDHAVTIYPNPSTQYVDILCRDGIAISQIEIYDMYGRLLLRSKASEGENPKRVSVTELTSGVYLMHVITDRGVVTKPFIKR